MGLNSSGGRSCQVPGDWEVEEEEGSATEAPLRSIGESQSGRKKM